VNRKKVYKKIQKRYLPPDLQPTPAEPPRERKKQKKGKKGRMRKS
jgi:hypothetical protein